MSEAATLTKYLLISCIAKLVPCAIPAEWDGAGVRDLSTSLQNQAAGINVYNADGMGNRKKDLGQVSLFFSE